jgi:hypothetical protein
MKAMLVKAYRSELSRLPYDSKADPGQTVVEVQLVVEMEPAPRISARPILKVLEGGVTGYESMYLESPNVEEVLAHGWNACAGTVGRWDALFIPPESIQRVLLAFAVTKWTK